MPESFIKHIQNIVNQSKVFWTNLDITILCTFINLYAKKNPNKKQHV